MYIIHKLARVEKSSLPKALREGEREFASLVEREIARVTRR